MSIFRSSYWDSDWRIEGRSRREREEVFGTTCKGMGQVDVEIAHKDHIMILFLQQLDCVR